MNGFLVLARCRFSDVPLRLCATRREARRYAATVAAESPPKSAIAPAPDAAGPGCLGSPGVWDACLVVSIVRFADGVPEPWKKWEVALTFLQRPAAEPAKEQAQP